MTLGEYRDARIKDFENANDMKLNPLQRLIFTYGIASGLAYVSKEIADVNLIEFSEFEREG